MAINYTKLITPVNLTLLFLCLDNKNNNNNNNYVTAARKKEH